MEKKQQDSLFTKLHVISIILVIVTLFEFGHGENKRDQVRMLMSLQHAKMYPQHFFENSKPWAEANFTDVDEGVEDMESFSEVERRTKEEDLILGGLPGQPPSSFKQYGGYVNVDKRNGRSLFYYFVESVDSPDTKPLILWLNGGPGCSSLGMGAFVELGPFGVNPDGKTLYPRRYAWNKVANVLFLESPAGVGFSYSNTSADYGKSGDKKTAQDSYKFIVNWFKRYPQYKARSLYIAGESYAGFYIPELADLIVNRNNLPKTTLTIQLKGIMVGNGIMNGDTDARGLYDYIWSHALISDETHSAMLENCLPKRGKKCNHIESAAGTEMGSLDFYSIYSPLCFDSKSPKKVKRNAGYDPCESDYVHSYLNLPAVQKALHANTTKLPYTWELCSDLIRSWMYGPSTMFPIYRRLMATGLQILLFSGDQDAVVSVTATRYSLKAMNLTVIKPWHLWQDGTKEVGGYKVVYDGLTFATVRGAGHQVPQFQPRRAFALLQMFLANNHH